MKKVIILFALLFLIQSVNVGLLNAHSLYSEIDEHVSLNNNQHENDTVKILFIGSSYFNYNNLPDIFENIALNSGKELFVDQYGGNGLFLSDHASSSHTRAKIDEQDWDFVILQGVGRNMAYPDYFTDHPVYPSLITLNEIIHQNCESTKMIYCLPWAFEDGMTWYQDWTDTYEDMQLKIFDTTINYSKDIGFIIAPVGWAWYKILDENDYPLHYLHMSDWNHPSFKGSYVMACVIFSTVYVESSVNNPFYGQLTEYEAVYFQTIASNTVLDNLSLWNINEGNTPPQKPLKPQGKTEGNHKKTYDYSSSTTDIDGDSIYYLFDWGDGTYSEWIGPYNSGEIISLNHSWDNQGDYQVRVKAKDNNDQSEWSDPLVVKMPKNLIVHRFSTLLYQKIVTFLYYFQNGGI